MLFFPGISKSYLGYIYVGRTYWIIWLVYTFIYLISLFVNFILFPYFGHVYILITNIIKMLFKLQFRIISIIEQRQFSNWDLIYYKINEKLEIVVTIYSQKKKRFKHKYIDNVRKVSHLIGNYAIILMNNLLVSNSLNLQS